MTSVSRSMTTRLLIAAMAGGCATAAMAQGLAPIERTFSNGSTLRFYGQINKGILNYDDGIDTETYYVIDNDNSNTRFGFLYRQDFNDWTFENVNEFQYAPYSTSNINVIDQSPSSEDYDWGNGNIRKIDFSFAHDRYGKFSLGQGSMATDGVAEVDLSGTGVIAYSGIADSASGQIIRYSDPALGPALDFANNPRIGDTFLNYDGGRLVRVRYDTPSFSNFGVAVAFGRNLLSSDSDTREVNQYDVALSWGDTYDSFEVGAAVGYFADDADTSVWAGSVSALHTPTGLNGTFAAGTQDEDGQSGDYWYGKLGLVREFVAWGDSAVSIDYYSGSDIFQTGDVLLFDTDGNAVTDDNGDQISGDITSSDSTSWGLAVVQDVPAWKTQFWLTFRSYDYSDNFASYEDGQAIFGGARFRF